MNLEKIIALKPIWKWTTGDWFICIGIVIAYVAVRHCLYFWYTFKIAESQYQKKFTFFLQECKDSWDRWKKFF